MAVPGLVGRVAEISGWGAQAVLTAAIRWVAAAQRQGEPTAWLTLPDRCFFPPDAAANGVDLQALVVVRVPDVVGMAKAADLLARSGGFGLLVLDMGRLRLTDRQLARLLGLVQKYQSVLLVLTHKPAAAPAMSSLVSWRAEACRMRGGIRLTVIKDKRKGPGEWYEERCRGPAGVRESAGPAFAAVDAATSRVAR